MAKKNRKPIFEGWVIDGVTYPTAQDIPQEIRLAFMKRFFEVDAELEARRQKYSTLPL